MKNPKFRAIEVYLPNGWKPQVFSEYLNAYIDLKVCAEVFKTPEAAIRWAQENWR